MVTERAVPAYKGAALLVLSRQTYSYGPSGQMAGAAPPPRSLFRRRQPETGGGIQTYEGIIFLKFNLVYLVHNYDIVVTEYTAQRSITSDAGETRGRWH